MENNQEHKIDKIFRETFENQSFTPPTDAWMGIHNYTIGQEESKKKVWVKYASLALSLFLISGLGLWYFADNQDVSPVAGLPTSPLVRKHTQKSILPTTGIAVTSISPRPIVHKHTQMLHTPEVDWSGDKPRGEEVVSGDTDHGGTLLSHELLVENTNNGENGGTLLSHELLVENTNNGENYSIENIDSKPLIINGLTDKMQKESERKIVALEEKLDDKKEIYKPDSVVYGKGFSLKHPIITFGIFGTAWNFWNFGENVIGRTYFSNERNSVVKLGIAWKINKKLRIGISLGTSHYSLGSPTVSILPQNSSLGGTYVKLTQINSDQFYQAETPFGGVIIPVVQLKDIPYANPSKLDSLKLLDYYGVLPHSMQTTSFSLNLQYDLLTIQRKKGKHYKYQIYGLSDFNIQRQTSYFYTAKAQIYSQSYGQNFLDIYAENNHLQNASEFVFGLRAGLGFRYQFARKWDFYVEGSGLHSLNNWVKSDDIKTFQRTLSLQAGINLNL
jgi:hypothetical protein